MEEQKSFIIDGEGVIVAHPDSTQVEELYNYAELTKTVSCKDSNGNVLTDEDGNILTEEHKIVIYETFFKTVSLAIYNLQST